MNSIRNGPVSLATNARALERICATTSRVGPAACGWTGRSSSSTSSTPLTGGGSLSQPAGSARPGSSHDQAVSPVEESARTPGMRSTRVVVVSDSTTEAGRAVVARAVGQFRGQGRPPRPDRAGVGAAQDRCGSHDDLVVRARLGRRRAGADPAADRRCQPIDVPGAHELAGLGRGDELRGPVVDVVGHDRDTCAQRAQDGKGEGLAATGPHGEDGVRERGEVVRRRGDDADPACQPEIPSQREQGVGLVALADHVESQAEVRGHRRLGRTQHVVMS